MNNLENWLQEGQQLQNEATDAELEAREAESEVSKKRFRQEYCKDKVGHFRLKKAGFQRVLDGTPAQEIADAAARQGENLNPEDLEALTLTEELYRLVAQEIPEAEAAAAAKQKAADDAAARLEKHNANPPSDAIEQIAESRAEAEKLGSEIEQLDAAIQRVENQPNQDEAALNKLAEAEAAYAEALADSELNPGDKKLVAKAEKLRTELDAARADASRPGEDRSHKLQALRQRQAKAKDRLAELDAITRNAIAATHTPRLDQSRAAIKAAIQKHLIPAIAKHNALTELLQEHRPDGSDFSHELTRLDFMASLLDTNGEVEGHEIHAKTFSTETNRLTTALGV